MELRNDLIEVLDEYRDRDDITREDIQDIVSEFCLDEE